MGLLFKSFLKKNTDAMKKEMEATNKRFQLQEESEANQVTDDYHKVIGKMSAFFAHEIRNPLTSIIGFTYFLERTEVVKSDPTISNYISIIKDEAVKIELLIQELLSLSNTHVYQKSLSIIDVKHSINKVINLYTMQATDKNINFVTNLTDDAYITGNESSFERVLSNMFLNSIEAIVVDGTISVISNVDNNYIYIDIIDDGPGISEEHLEQIFFPFYTTKDEGTGIGLPICKTIIETLNGSIDIQNHASKKGVHVKIKLPKSKHSSYKS